MASSRRTYDTDVITLRKVFAKEPGNSNVPALRTLTADGLGGTYWAIPSSLGLNPSFNEIITSAGTYTADLSYNKFRLLAGENIGMLNGSPGSNETILFAKAFSQFDISGENTIVAYNSNNQLDSSVTLAGQGGITLRGDPATNTLFIVGPASNSYTVSTGIYGFSQIKVTEATSSITPYVQGLPGTFITATSPSTLLRMIGIEDILLSTNVTSGSIFFTISTFTSKGYLDISANAYAAYPSTLSTVSSLYVQIPQFLSGITGAILEGSYNYSSLSSGLKSLAFSTSEEFDRVWGQIAERAYIQQLLDTEIVLNNNIQSTSVGLGTLGYISTGGGAVVGKEQLVSTVEGLGSAGYISSGVAGDVTTANLVSTVGGLGSSGYFSSLSTIITSTIFNTGAISTNSLEVFGAATLTCGGSTILRGPIYLGGPIFVAGSFTGLPNTIVTPANQQSTVAGLGTSRYVSTLSLQSTIRGLGSASYISSSQLLSSLAGLGSLGYLSSLNGFTISTGNVFASSLNLLDVFTNDVNYLTVSSGSLLLNGAKVSEGGGGGGGGNVAQIVAGTGINVNPAGGTGVVTIINTGPTITNVNDAISSFSTALGPVGGGGGGAAYNFSTVSSVYGSTFNTGLLFASTMNTATILPSQSNLWVAVGYGASTVDTLQYSGDGRNWSNSMSGGFSTAGKGVAYNGSLWVAVGANGTSLGSIQSSTDGKNWFTSASGGFSSGGNGIAYNGTIWIAVGNNGGDTATSIQYSIDGKNWSGIVSGGFSVNGEGIAWNGSYWVATGQGGSATESIQYSLDGLNWISATTGGFATAGKGIAWNGSLWVAAGDDISSLLSLQYSGDGKNWSNAVSGGFSSAGWKVAWNGSLWVAVGDDTDILKSIQYSMDGMSWNDIVSGGFTNESDGYGIAWNGSYWVAVGAGDTAPESVQISIDGINWTSATTGGFSFGGVGIGFSSNLAPGYSQQNLTILSQNIPLFLTPNNQILAKPSSLVVNDMFVVDRQWKRIGVNCNTPAYDLDVNGIGHFLTLSTLGLNISSLNGFNYLTILPSTVAGLATVGYVSTASLVSTVGGLGTTWFNSTIAGLGTVGYVSTSGLTSTVRGLGTIGFLSSLSNVPLISTQQLIASSITAPIISTSLLNTSSITGINLSTGSLYASSIMNVNMAQTNTNLWVAVGNDTGATPVRPVKYSYDGINWTSASSQVFSGNQGFGVAWNGKVWVAVGSDSAQSVKYSYDGINWSSAASPSQVFANNVGRGVAWNGRLWVAVGQDTGAASPQPVKYSYDGINWFSAAGSTVFANNIGYGVSWNGRLWVAVGVDTLAVTPQPVKYSYDGINWTSAAGSAVFSGNIGYGVAWNGRLWVAVGSDSTQCVKYSYDGINWTSAAGSAVFNANVGYGVAWNGSIWVAVGQDSAQNVKYSYDGINWTSVSGSKVFNNSGRGVSWNGKVWVAVGDDTGAVSPQPVKYSYDGINWTSASGSKVFNNNIGYAVAYSANLIPAYNQTNFEIEAQNIPNFLTSTNQLSFLASTIITNNTLFVDTTNRVGINTGTPQTDLDVYGIGRFLTVSTFAVNASSITAPVISTSLLNTSSLTSVFLSSFAVNASSIRAPIISTSLLNTSSLTSVFLSSFAVNASSITGINVSTGSLYASSITNVNMAQTNTNLWVAVGFSGTQNNRIKYSYDGRNWFNSSGTAFTGWGRAVAWNGRLWVAVGYNGGATTGTIRYSTDGITWSGNPSGGFNNQAYGVAWNGRIWVAVGNNTGAPGSIQYSTDGITWSANLSGGFATRGTGIAWNGRIWVAVGIGGTADSSIQYSTDGITWTNSSSGGFSYAGYGIVWNGRIWVAVGDNAGAPGTIKYSTDGINWFNSSSGGFSTQGNSVAWNGRMWVAVGAGGSTLGSIQYSIDGITWNNNLTGGFTSTTYGSGISWNGSLWVAVGQGSVVAETIQYSSDGINWTSSSSGGFDLTGSTYIGTGVAYSSNVIPSYNQTNFEIEPQNIPVFLRSTNTMSFLASTIITNNTLFVDTTNRVGINTGTPQYTLDVNGTTRSLYSTILANGAYGVVMASGGTANTGSANQTSIQGYNIGAGTKANLHLQPTGGNLGVGIPTGTAPSYTLDVRGQSRSFYSTFLVNGNYGAVMASGGTADTGSANQTSIQAYNLGAGITANLHLQPTGGNLGVGIPTGTAPSYTVDVTGFARIQSASVSGPPSLLNLKNTGANVLANLAIEAGFSGVGPTGNIARISLSTTGAGGGTVGQTIDSSYEGAQYGISIRAEKSTIMRFTGGSGVTRDNLRVGILTSSPDYTLDVNGSARLSTILNVNIAQSSNLWVAVGNNGGAAGSIRYSTDGITWVSASGTGFVTSGRSVAYNGLIWVAVGNNLGASGSIKYSYDGITWVNASGTGFSSSGWGVLWNGTIWIAVGVDSTQNIKYSTDGITWRDIAGTVFATGAYAIGWNGSMFIAGGNNSSSQNIKYSYNGLIWNDVTNPSKVFSVDVYSVAWNGRMWVAVGTDSVQNVKYSYDGLIWNNANGPKVFSGTNSTGVAWNGRMWVAVGFDSTQNIIYSYDGINWSDAAGSLLFSTNGNGVAWNGKLWVAGGESSVQNLKYSYDGVNWTNASGSRVFSGSCIGIGYSSNVPSYYQSNFEIEAQNIPVFVRSTNTISFLASSIIANNTLFVDTSNKVGINTGNPLYSLDVNGTTRLTNLNVIAQSSDLFVSVGDAAIKYSRDGINWTASGTSFGVDGYGVAYNGSMWVAVGRDTTAANTIKYSYDGINWTNSSSGGFTGVGTGGNVAGGLGVAWNGRIWIAVGRDDTPANTIKYSTDGINWFNSVSGAFTGTGTGANCGSGRGAVWNGKIWIAVGNNIPQDANTIKYSKDGISWLNATGGFAYTGHGVGWNGRMWVACGEDTTTQGSIKYSYDGINWFNSVGGTVFSAGRGYTAAWNGRMWLAGGYMDSPNTPNGSIKYSFDGITWANITSGGFSGDNVTRYSFCRSITWNGRLWVAVGSDTTAANQTKYSTDGLNWLNSTGGGFGTNGGGVAYNAIPTPSYNQTNFEVEPQNIPVFLRSTNQMSFTVSSIILNNTLTVDTTNRVGINTGIPQYTLDIEGNSRISSLIVGTPTTNPSTSAFLLTLTRDLAVKPFTTVWNTSSDKRIKENIVDADYDRCYDDVKSLQLRRFTWASTFFNDAGGYDKRVLGFIAQEVSSIVPKAVTVTEANGYSNFHYLNIDQLNMSLYGAVKRTILDKEYMESTIKGQRVHIETLQGTTTCILSTLEGLQGR